MTRPYIIIKSSPLLVTVQLTKVVVRYQCSYNMSPIAQHGYARFCRESQYERRSLSMIPMIPATIASRLSFSYQHGKVARMHALSSCSASDAAPAKK